MWALRLARADGGSVPVIDIESRRVRQMAIAVAPSEGRGGENGCVDVHLYNMCSHTQILM